MGRIALLFVSLFLVPSTTAWGQGIITYGDMDVLGTGTYGANPTAPATIFGLQSGSVTFGGAEVNHSFPFSPETGDFAGTDQIFTSSNQTATGDGYSAFPDRIAGPQIITLDYSPLVADASLINTLTLGIAADDFQFPLFGQPFEATINGTLFQPLTDVLNGLDQTGPQVQFFTIGIDPNLLTSDRQLILSIDQNGDGRDGWAVDFLTVGVTAVPEPSSGLFAIAALTSCLLNRRRHAG